MNEDIPMPKTITVTDAQGNACQPTWPKRAKGPVKHGRAVYISENEIRLTPPPCKTEEEAMTANDILQKIFELSNDTKHIDNALTTLSAMPDKPDNGDCAAPPDIAGQAKAQAIAEVTCSAESTRQQLLAFYIRVYKELSGHPAAVDEAAPAMRIAADHS